MILSFFLIFILRDFPLLDSLLLSRSQPWIFTLFDFQVAHLFLCTFPVAEGKKFFV